MTRVTIDISQLDALAGRLGRVDGETLGRRAAEAVNEVTLRFSEQAQAAEIADINLSPAYVRSKTDVVLSPLVGQSPEATITTRWSATILGRFEPVIQLREPSTRSKRRGPRRGKPAGVAVSIRKSRVEVQPKWFTMRLRRGRYEGSDIGVFVRSSAKGGKPKHIYGVSPYSLFRHQVNVRADDLQDDLTRTAVDRLGSAIEEAL